MPRKTSSESTIIIPHSHICAFIREFDEKTLLYSQQAALCFLNPHNKGTVKYWSWFGGFWLAWEFIPLISFKHPLTGQAVNGDPSTDYNDVAVVQHQNLFVFYFILASSYFRQSYINIATGLQLMTTSCNLFLSN
jgi:hypothetical protein